MAGAMRKVGVYLGLLEDTRPLRGRLRRRRRGAPAPEPVNRPVRAVRDDRPAPVSSLSERRPPDARS